MYNKSKQEPAQLLTNKPRSQMSGAKSDDDVTVTQG